MSSHVRYRLWLESLDEGPLVLTGERAHYLRRVLRVTRGTELTVLGGDGRLARATVAGVQAAAVELVVEAPQSAPPLALELTVAVAAPKGERADWLVEKLTELGVAQIVWTNTCRSVVAPRGHGTRAQRWQRLAQAAARQAGRARAPLIAGPLELEEVLRLGAERRYIATPSGTPLVHALALKATRAILLIGPEGGFTFEELSQARDSDYLPASLGSYTLRVETAAIAGAAMLLADSVDVVALASEQREAS
jgi:16S rRNA (uracil1498-N3)-methyltransferase